MASNVAGQIYKMKLADFARYLGDKRNEMEACVAKVTAIQQRFTAIFTVELAEWQKVFGYCFVEVGTQRPELPAPFAAVLDKAELEERARITKEVADLDEQVSAKRARMDELLAQSQNVTGGLAADNPDVNAREEKLKSLMVRYQDEYAQAYEAIDKLQEGLFGELAHWGKIRQLRKVQRRAKKQQHETLRLLRQVRQGWLSQVEQAGDQQSTFRDEWQKLGVEVADAESQREHRALHFDDLVVEATLTRVLEGLDTPPSVPGELGAKLAELVQRNEVRKAYEAGLQAAAETIGMANGIGKGMARFHESVKQVLAQQKQYSLKPVTIALPQTAAVLNEAWRILTEKVDNEEYYAKHPREFVQFEEQYIKKPLTDENIKSLFETMGDALNRGTAVWK
jgi:hypothetical protein